MALLPSDEKKSRIICRNRRDYPDIYDQLKLISPEQAATAEQQRLDLLHAITGSGGINGCRGTKPYTRQLSPGCRLCVEGSWSCLFINGRCNLRCFYCPSSQDDIGEPTTNNLSFSSPDNYLEYLNHFGFRGFSLSGGEPLLTPERSLDYLRCVKKHLKTPTPVSGLVPQVEISSILPHHSGATSTQVICRSRLTTPKPVSARRSLIIIRSMK